MTLYILLVLAVIAAISWTWMGLDLRRERLRSQSHVDAYQQALDHHNFERKISC